MLTLGILLKSRLFYFSGHSKSGIHMHIMFFSPIFNSFKGELYCFEPKRKMIGTISYNIIDSSYLHLREQCLKAVFQLLSDHTFNSNCRTARLSHLKAVLLTLGGKVIPGLTAEPHNAPSPF